MFGATSDPGHRCILAMLRLTGKLPRTGSGRERAAGGSIVTAVAKLALAATVTALYARVVRPRLLHSGATEEEVARDYSGAELVPGGTRGATMAATIEVPPSQVWPWLIQMGCDRAGWYSWDRLDNAGVSSADLIHPEWQQIAVGDHLLSRPDGSTWFEVAAVEPERFLALRATFDLRGRPLDPAAPLPRAYTDSVWCFLLTEMPGRRTRLVVSGYATGRPERRLAIQNALFWEPAYWVMQRRQFANLRRRAEAGPPEGDQGTAASISRASARPTSALG
jgi:hypothetical protein